MPILGQIKSWLDAEQDVVLPRSPMGEAFTYVLNQWNARNAYTREGFLNIDNNAAERHALDPKRYLTSVLAQLPALPAPELPQLLSDLWKAAVESSITTPDT